MIKHINYIYNECLKYPETTISTAQSIIKSIKEYISTNKLDLKVQLYLYEFGQFFSI